MASQPGWSLAGLPLLSRATVDRAALAREDPEQVRVLWNRGRLLWMDSRDRVPAAEGQLVLATAVEVADEPPGSAVLLGAEGEIGYWALRAADAPAGKGPLELEDDAIAGENRPRLGFHGTITDLVGVATQLNDMDAGLFTTAVSVMGWHDRARFCAVCGGVTERIHCGWSRRCESCGREEYPRTDPAVICLVHDEAGNVLLGRQPRWPAERYSLLAGFVEIGESLEATVVREVLEEVGIAVRNVSYVGSQPWPFPRSLMVGFSAVADAGAVPRLQEDEIEDARWFSAAEVKDALASPDGRIPGLILPPAISIAHRMLAGWVGAW